MTNLDFFIRILVAAALGAMIGIERQITRKSAGIRTCLLVCLGSCIFTTFSYYLEVGDVARVAMQVISGVGFLCSGIIFKNGSNVHGLNSAATVWCTAGIGMFCGSGLYIPAVIAAAVVLAVNLILRFVGLKSMKWRRHEDFGRKYRVSISCSSEEAPEVRKKLTDLLSTEKFYLSYLNEKQVSDKEVVLEARFSYIAKSSQKASDVVLKELECYPSVKDTEWEILD